MKKVKTACIIDDDPISVMIAKKLMELSNFCSNILVFKDGQEAVTNLKENHASGGAMPEIILLDLNMPVMNGWEFLNSMSQILEQQKCSIFIVTSSIDRSDLERARNHKDVVDCVVKPLTHQSLPGILNKCYEQKQSIRRG